MNFSVAAVFSDNMVLQRNKNISFFGTADKGTRVQVCLSDDKGNVLAQNSTVADGKKWMVQLAPQKERENVVVKVTAGGAAGVAGAEKNGRLVEKSGTFDEKCSSFVEKRDGSEKSEVVFKNVAIGEVWLAGGQSNMEFELQNCDEAQEAFAMTGAASPNVRFYYTNKIGWKDESFYEAEKNTCWQTWQSDGKKSWSAVGFFYAEKLSRDLGCTVGLIGCNWGGTSASAWMRKEYLEKDDDLRTYLTEQEEAVRGKTVEQQIKEYNDYEVEMAKWQAGFDKLWVKDHNITWESANKILGQNPWPGPRSCKNPYRPCGLYDCMLSRVLPYTIQGVIWYQGESDDHKPGMYFKLFSAMIQNWRDDWQDDRLPFVFVQLPNHRYQADKDFKHWCLIREAQEKVFNVVKNTWMTCGLDLGLFSDIHPRAKKALAWRMEECALESVYKLGDGRKSAYSPMFSSALVQGEKIIVSFKNAGEGFELRQDSVRLEEYCKMEQAQGTPVPSDYTGFEIAGDDGVYFPAQFELGGAGVSDAADADSDAGVENLAPNQIVLSSKKVPAPKYARYAWRNYGPVTIYSKSGLPLAPFRTNPQDSAATTEHAEIQQIMTV